MWFQIIFVHVSCILFARTASGSVFPDCPLFARPNCRLPRDVYVRWVYVRWTPHPVIVAIKLKDNKDYIRVLFYSYYATNTGWGVLLMYMLFALLLLFLPSCFAFVRCIFHLKKCTGHANVQNMCKGRHAREMQNSYVEAEGMQSQLKKIKCTVFTESGSYEFAEIIMLPRNSIPYMIPLFSGQRS